MSQHEISEQAGVRYDGAQVGGRKGTLLLFTDPTTGSTFAVAERAMTVEGLQAALAASRARFAPAVAS